MSRSLALPVVLASLLPLVGCGGNTTHPDGGVLDLRVSDLTVAKKDGPVEDMTVAKTDASADMTMVKMDAGPMTDAASTTDAKTMTDATAMTDSAMPMTDSAMAMDMAMQMGDASTDDAFVQLDSAVPGDMTVPSDMAMLAMPTFLALLVGDGQAALSSASTPGFLQKFQLDGTAVGNPIPIPVAANMANLPCTFTGNSISEGSLSLSGNGKYVVFGCYDAIPGVAAISGTTVGTMQGQVPREVGRIDAMGNIDTSTRIVDGFNKSNIRGATSQDGTTFWASGTASDTTGGVHYVLLGGMTSVQVIGTPNNSRWSHVFGGQLYTTSGSGNFTNVFTDGTGLPTMAAQTATVLPGLPVAGGSPYSFALFDRDVNVAGLDTLYVADDRDINAGGGILKWTFDGQNWKAAAFTTGLTVGVRGLAGMVIGNSVTLVATTKGVLATDPTSIVVIADDGVQMVKTIATSGMNTAYRGVAFSPN